MEFLKLNEPKNIAQNKKLIAKIEYFGKLINELKKREIDSSIVSYVNKEIEKTNIFSGSDRALLKQIKKSISSILKLLETELQLVINHHYQNTWMAYGMLGGVLFSTIFSQLGVSETWTTMGMGISMGMIFGMMAGKNRDKKAKQMGLQLNL